MAGLSPNIRLVDSTPPPSPQQARDVTVAQNDDPVNGEIRNGNGDLLRIEPDDGSITITTDGTPLEKATKTGPGGWWDNLVDEIDAMELTRMAEEILRGIRDDITSRQEWIDDRANGMRLLGLKLDLPGLGGSADGAPVEGISRVRHPLLLEAVLRFQANARSELLPTDGPVKVRDDGNGDDVNQDRLADYLEKDLNHYLTSTASEYYPDTDRMLLMLGFGGTSFKKVHQCPLRNRPVSETVDAEDLIVNNSATDLKNATRVTHRISLKPSTVKRMQILGVYRDIPLHTPNMAQLDAVQIERKAQEGISINSMNPEDRDREIYECYCELDIKGYEHEMKGKPTGLEIPYRVTIDVSSRQVLSVVRNYEEDTKELPEARTTFIKYTFVPGFGFYDIGLLAILGNTTNAITAAWRELLDAGMYSNFPGFLMADSGSRQNTNIFRVPPGGGAPVKTNGMPIRDAIMPLPYQPPQPALMQLVNDIAQTGMRIGGTSEQAVGEGRADAPVGTTLAMIEQATKVMNSVHKRLHASQAQEFQLLAKVFKEHPKSFWQQNRKPAYKWDEQTFLDALEDADIVPQADPNTASHGQRVMKIMALKQLQAAQPSLYDPIAIDRAALVALGFNNPDQFLAPPQAQASPPPELQQIQAQIQQGNIVAGAQKTAADARMLDAQTKRAEAQAKIQGGLAGGEGKSTGPSSAELELKQADLKTKAAGLALQHQNTEQETASRTADREADLKIQQMKLEADTQNKHADRQHEVLMGALTAHKENTQQAAELSEHEQDRRADIAKTLAGKVMDGRNAQAKAAATPKLKAPGPVKPRKAKLV